MRTTLKIIIALTVIGSAFGLYWWLQPATHMGVARIVPTGPAATRPSLDHSDFPLEKGQSVWVKQYDDQGRISYQFKAEEYIPIGGGNVNVTQPRTVFY